MQYDKKYMANIEYPAKSIDSLAVNVDNLIPNKDERIKVPIQLANIVNSHFFTY